MPTPPRRSVVARAAVLILAGASLLSCSPSASDEAAGPTVVDDVGQTVALRAPAQRVFSVAPSVTESVAALDPDLLVARTRFDRQPELEHLPSLGGTLRPNLEALARLRPDLVVAFSDAGQRSVADQVEALGIPVYRADVETIEDALALIGKMGVLLGREDRAEALVDSLRAGLERVEAAVAGKTPVNVYYSVWHDPPQTTGPDTFIDEVIRRAGGRNVFEDAPAPWPQVSLEEIVHRGPDVLVIARHQGGSVDAPWLDGTGWRELDAVREGRYTVVDGDLFNRPGPRMAEAAQKLARFLHGPELLAADTPR